MPETDSPKKTIRVPFEYGEIVYHRAAAEREPGIVTGYSCRPGGVMLLVTWPDRYEKMHYFCELTTEYLPDFASESPSCPNEA